MSIFVKSNQELKVVVFTAVDTKGRMIAYSEGVDLPPDLKIVGATSRYEILFRYPTYRDTLDITDNGVVMTNTGDIALNSQEMRFKRLSKLIKSWNFVDDEGKPVECNKDNIEMLDPIVAGAITHGLEKGLGLVPD